MPIQFKTVLIIFFLFASITTYAQISVGESGSAPAASAMLDVQSTDKGALVPRMTTMQRTAIVSPAEGLMVYDSTTHSFWFYKKSAWSEVAKLTEAGVDAFVANNGYLTSEIDGSVTNEIQDLELVDNTLSITGGNSVNLSSIADDEDWVTTSGTNVTNGNEGNVGIGNMASSQNRWQLTVKDTVDAMLGSDSIDVSELFAVFTRNLNENNTGIGIGFQSTSTVTGMGAAIVHERTNSNSRGKLHFATKRSGSAADEDLPINMTLDEVGRLGVGITSPTEKLHVNGNAKIEGTLDVTGNVTVNGNALVPIGTIQMWPTTTAPTGWFICDGTSFNVATYPDLNAVLGGNTLPNFKGRFPLGANFPVSPGGHAHPIHTTGGEEEHTLTVTEMPSHSHNIIYREGEEQGSGNDYSDLGGAGITGSTEATGGGQPHNNMPPFYTINFIIKAE